MGLNFDVIVVGAGPAGSVAAALLAQAGVRVALLERAPAPFEKICGEYVGPRAVEDLERLGFAEALRSVPTRALSGMVMVAPDGSAVAAEFVAEDGAARRGLSVARQEFDGALQQEARRRGAQLEFGQSVAGVDSGPDGVVVRTRAGGTSTGSQPSEWRARWLIGADGRFSGVARAVGLAASPRNEGGAAGRTKRGVIHAWFRGVPGLLDLGEMHLLRDGSYLGLDPLADGRVNAGLVVDVGTVVAALRQRDGEKRLRASLLQSPPLARRFAAATLDGEVRYLAPMRTEVRAVAAGRTLLAGDAAGFLDPLTGEGIYLAIASAECAARAVGSALHAGDRERDALAARASYARAHARLVRGKRLLHPLLQALLRRPALANRIAARLQPAPAAAQRLLGVIANLRGPSALLHPSFWALLLRSPCAPAVSAHAQ